MKEWPKACAMIYRRRGSEKLENTPIGATKPLMFREGQTEGRNGLPVPRCTFGQDFKKRDKQLT